MLCTAVCLKAIRYNIRGGPTACKCIPPTLQQFGREFLLHLLRCNIGGASFNHVSIWGQQGTGRRETTLLPGRQQEAALSGRGRWRLDVRHGDVWERPVVMTPPRQECAPSPVGPFVLRDHLGRSFDVNNNDRRPPQWRRNRVYSHVVGPSLDVWLWDAWNILAGRQLRCACGIFFHMQPASVKK